MLAHNMAAKGNYQYEPRSIHRCVLVAATGPAGAAISSPG